MHESGHFIAVEGVIGAGKTTLTKEIAKHFGFHTVLEPVEDNPFLAVMYKDPDLYAFQTEVFILANRYTHLKKIKKLLNVGGSVVADYHIENGIYFASIYLKDDELNKYEQIYKQMVQGFELPRIIVHIKLPTIELIKRITKRGRDMEKNIDVNFIETLNRIYNQEITIDRLQEKYGDVMLVEIDGTKVDFKKQPERLNDVFQAIENVINSNKKYQIIE